MSRDEICQRLRGNLAAAGLPVPPVTRQMRYRAYRRLRTGLSFTEVARMLWVPSTDPKDWRRKTRGLVLYTWWKIKQEMWREAERREDEATAADRGYPASWDDVGGGGQLRGGE